MPTAASDILLVFPPVAMLMQAPELGLPQLSAYLKSKGKSARVLDLNLLFLFQYLCQSKTHNILRQRREMRSEAIKKILPKAEPEINWHDYTHKKLINYQRKYTKLLNPNVSWQIDDIVQNASNKDALFAPFYEAYLQNQAEGADIIGFEILTHEQLPAVLYFANKLKSDFPKKLIILGGPWATASRSVLKKWGSIFSIIDFIVLHTGELPTEAIIEFRQGKLKKENIPGIVYYSNGSIKENKLMPPIPISELPLPDFTDLPLQLYTRQTLTARNSSGCPYGKCLFCYHCFPGNKYFQRKAAQTISEIKQLADINGLRRFSMADLSIPPLALAELAKELIKQNAAIKWDAMTRADMRYSKNFCKLLKLSGCIELLVGVEVQDAKEQAKLNKGIKDGAFENMLFNLSDAGIAMAAFLLNYPGLPEEIFEKSIKYLEELEGKIKLLSLIMADFELGRASNAMEHLDLFGIILPDNIDTDVRSFSLPFETKVPFRRIFPYL